MTESDSDFQTTFAKLESLVKESNFSEVQNRLEKIKEIPRHYLAKTANLAIRSGQPLWALNKLHKYVHLDQETNMEAHRAELMSYAHALYFLGSTQSARQILEQNLFSNDEIALSHLANSYIHDWNYSPAAEIFQRLLNMGKNQMTAYQFKVMQTNFAASLISCGRYSVAQSVLQEICDFCLLNDHKLLLGNIYELMGQVLFFQKNYVAAQESFQKSLATFVDQAGVYALFSKKWLLIADLALGKKPIEIEDKCQLILQQADKFELWDIRRDLDFFKGVFSNDSELIKYVVNGSIKNYSNLRMQFFDQQPSFSNLVNFVPHCDRQEKEKLTIVINEKMTDTTRNIFFALTSDFYAPLKMGRLFELVYPGEVFSPKTSAARVMKALKRLDSYFVEMNLPLRVQFCKSNFRLIAKHPCRVQFLRPKNNNQLLLELHPLNVRFADRKFTSQDAASVIGKSIATTQRLLKAALLEGVLVSSGKGRSTCYQFASHALFSTESVAA